jgi:serine/threonine protein kinase
MERGCRYLDIWMPRKELPFPPASFNSDFPSPQIYEFVIGRPLFQYIPRKKPQLEKTEHILYQMICHTGEDFSEEQLTASPLAGKYFDLTCTISLTCYYYPPLKFNAIRTGNLRSHPTLLDYSFELALRNQDILDEPDVLSTAALMKKCLHLDPADRASADDLLKDPWFAGIDD